MTTFAAPGSTLKAGLLMALESAINNSLDYDPATRQKLGSLDGKVLALACTRPNVTVYVLFVGEHVELWSLFEGASDATLSGNASAFLQLWRARKKPTALADSGVTLTGDSGVMQTIQAISRDMEIDWEALLAEHTGDIVAHQLGQAVRGAGYWLRSVRREAERLVSEYLQYETHTIPSRHDVQRFCNEVDDVTLRTDRLQARLDALLKERHVP